MSIACWTSLKNRVTRKVDVQCVMFAMEAEVPCDQRILHLGIKNFTKNTLASSEKISPFISQGRGPSPRVITHMTSTLRGPHLNIRCSVRNVV